MKFTSILCLFMLFVATANTHAQQILWNKNQPLRWDDFQGTKPSKKHAAHILTHIIYTIKKDSLDSISTDVKCFFFVKGSWKRHPRLSLWLLKHEQTHFDITEVHARKIRQAFHKYCSLHKFDDVTEKKLRAIYEENTKACRHMQHKYDRKTNHSKKREVQKEWNKKIAIQLAELQQYDISH